MTSKDFRSKAWGALSGKWGTFALAYLVMSLIMATSAIPYIGAIISLVITGPFTYALAFMSKKVVKGEPIAVGDTFEGFKRFKDSFLAGLINGIFVMLWSLLLVVPGIIKAISYSMTYYILNDNPNMDANEARKKSMAMMEGNKMRYFLLSLSFIGWMLLVGLTFGILGFWVIPYLNTAYAEFYESLKHEQGIQDAEVTAQYACNREEGKFM